MSADDSDASAKDSETSVGYSVASACEGTLLLPLEKAIYRIANFTAPKSVICHVFMGAGQAGSPADWRGA